MQRISKEHVKRLIAGDEIAFREIFDAYYVKLVGSVHKLVGELMPAQDIVTEVFKKIWERRGVLSGEGAFESFLYTSVRNAALNYIRNSSTKNNKLKTLQEVLWEDRYVEIVIEEDVHYKLYKAIDSLPEKMRRVFELSVIHNLKEKEIAEDLGISINTVKVHKQKALKHLRGRLGKHYIYLFFL